MPRISSLLTLFLFIASLLSFAQSTTEVARKGINSTVSVVTVDRNNQPKGFGSGFIVGDQTVITNLHVVEGGHNAYVFRTDDKKRYVISGYTAIDKIHDLVILQVENFSGPAIEFHTSSELPDIGERVYAIGNPKGLNGTFSEGVVSGIRDFPNRKVIQITAPISPGSSGGPILNSYGSLVGVAFGSYKDGQNINFAIPLKEVNALLSQKGEVRPISTIKPLPKPATSATNNIAEGVQIRNIESIFENIPGYPPYFTGLTFSIRNNLPNNVSDVRVLFIVFDFTGTVSDSFEGVFFRKINSYAGIKPYLARSFNGYGGTKYKHQVSYSEHVFENSQEPHEMIVKPGYKIVARVLDFKINE